MWVTRDVEKKIPIILSSATFIRLKSFSSLGIMTD